MIVSPEKFHSSVEKQEKSVEQIVKYATYM